MDCSRKVSSKAELFDLGPDKKADGRPLTNAMLKELGLSASEIDELERIPYAKLVEIYKKVLRNH